MIAIDVFIRRRHLLIVAALAIISGMTFGSAGFAASKGESPWVEENNSKVRLVSGTIDRDGAPMLYAGVQLRMDSGWKTYWRNPGDSGVPPTFDWSGSKNVKSIEVLYPIPHRFADANGTAIGYSDEVLFPVRITPERADQPVELALAFEYGLCKDLCIPNTVELNAVLPPDLGKGDARLLEAAVARVPKPAGPDSLPRLHQVTATLDGANPGLDVEVLFPQGATGTDLFIDNPDAVVAVPKAGPLEDGKQRFSVPFLTPGEAASIKNKPLVFTMVSDEGATETTWTAE